MIYRKLIPSQDRLDPVFNKGQDVLDATPQINSCMITTKKKDTRIYSLIHKRN